MTSNFAEWKFLAATAGLVLAMGVPTLASLTASDEARVPVALQAPAQKMRQPASLPGITSKYKKPLVIADTKKELNHLIDDESASIHFDLRCAKTMAQDFKIVGSYMQLKGKDCSKGTEASKITVINKTNGFTAAVFAMDNKAYQTDLIQLQNGENQISIQAENIQGQRQEFLLVVKAKAL